MLGIQLNMSDYCIKKKRCAFSLRQPIICALYRSGVYGPVSSCGRPVIRSLCGVCDALIPSSRIQHGRARCYLSGSPSDDGRPEQPHACGRRTRTDRAVADCDRPASRPTTGRHPTARRKILWTEDDRVRPNAIRTATPSFGPDNAHLISIRQVSSDAATLRLPLLLPSLVVLLCKCVY